ncbi:hypothetical protein W02_01850 [Nitrospira sp. KM1]|uniref:DUF4403 family protein n=1 Tax=Nitrospira sp. KM1 TaxID=1936990 RepID=UPI0013A757B9|nr:DUF4403 family protein [Nitrospira sp. KM1]BCA53045.1 hypothetical protein W02_01850 [Nitrospira sp. KM1]
MQRPPARNVIDRSILIASFMVATGCGGTAIDIPKPTGALAPPPPVPPVADSVVHLNISLPIRELALAVNASVPAESGHEDAWQDGGELPDHTALQYKYRMLRGPFHYQVVENKFLTQFPDIQYRLALRMTLPEGLSVEGNCGYSSADPAKHIKLKGHSAFNWTDHWTVRSTTSFDQPEFPDTCRLSNLDTDATPILKQLVNQRLRTLAESVDAMVRERSESRQRAQIIWQRLQEPVALRDDFWLLLNPTDVLAAPIGSDGNQTVQTSLEMLLRPTIHQGQKPEAGVRPLPPLRLTKNNQNGFNLAVPITIDYPYINERLRLRLIGQEIQTSVGEPMKITSAQLYGSGSKLIIELGVTGAMNGKIYATGNPVYDSTLQELKFANFDYTVDTKNVLVESADFFAHDSLLTQIEPETHIKLAGRMNAFKKQLSDTLTRDLDERTRLEGTVTALEPKGIYPVKGGVEIQMVAKGELKAQMR